MLETVRARLTLWYVSLFGAVLVAVCAAIYLLLARELAEQTDDTIHATTTIAITSLANDLAEGQDRDDAARSTAAELFSGDVTLAMYDESGRLLAFEGREDALRRVPLPPLETIPADSPHLFTTTVAGDRYRIGVRQARLDRYGKTYVVLIAASLEPIDDELESLLGILLSLVPGVLVLAGLVGWFLAKRSLSPVVVMAERARRIGVEDLRGRLPVANPHDELGRLADTFNELLGRLESSFSRQREFMADASHELRTPVATTRTAAAVALQQPHRTEYEYRETLRIIEQQTTRLSRIVDDMFTLARADAGNFPLRREPMYLDEVVDEVVRAARVLSAEHALDIDLATAPNSSYVGDEELIRRMVTNLLDNAVKHAEPHSTIHVRFDRTNRDYEIVVSNAGDPIPQEAQALIFERFSRGDPARARRANDVGGAGLGLAIARWVARAHGGDVRLVRSDFDGTLFRITLPRVEP